jgi:hypothetical protein
VLGEDRELLGGQRTAVADGGVAVDVAHGAHPGDDGGDGRGAQHEPQGGLRQRPGLDVQVGHDRPGPPLDLGRAVAAEVAVAEVALGEGRTGRDRAGQAALVQGDPDDHADAVLLAGRQEHFGGRLVEDVVDHLHGVDRAAAHQRERVVRLVVVDGDAEQPDLPLRLELGDGLQPVAAADPLVAPHVELEDVEVVEAARAQAGLQALPDVRAGERLGGVQAAGGRPHPVLRRDLGGDQDLVTGPLAHHPAHDAFALAVAAGGVDEVDAQVDGPVQGPYGLVLARPHPPRRADAPGAVADLRHGQPTASQLAIAHSRPLSLCLRVDPGLRVDLVAARLRPR